MADRMKIERKIQAYLKARREGNTAEQSRIQGTMKGPEMTLLARALEIEKAKEARATIEIAPARVLNTPNSAATQRPKEQKMAKAKTKTTPNTPVRTVPKATEKAEPKVGNVIKANYRAGFNAVDGLKTASGAKVVCTVFDEVVSLLAGKTPEELRAVASKYGVDYTWDHLNPGMQRMNLGNRLRAMVRKGEVTLAAPPKPAAPKKARKLAVAQ